MTSVNVTAPITKVTVNGSTSVVTATTAGPQGPQGLQGPQGPEIDFALLSQYSSPVNGDQLAIFDTAASDIKKVSIEDLIAKRARDSRRIYLSKDTKANDSNNGTSPEEPLLTFAAAIAAAEPGDVIEVAPGTYTEASLPLRVPRDVGISAKSLRQVRIQPAAGQEMNGFFKVDSGFWVWGLEFAGHQADLANNQQSWAVSFDEQADNTAAPLNASGLGAFILKSPYIQNCSSITAEDDAGNAGSVSVGDTGGGIEVDGDKCAANSPIRSMVVDSYTQVNLGGPGCLVRSDGYAQLVSFFGTFCTFHVKTETGGQANLSGGGTTDFGDQGLVADGYSRLPNFTGAARIASYGADRAEAAVTIDVNTDTFTTVSTHPLVANDQLTFNATDGTLPTGLAEATTYFVISSGLTSNNFKVSLTQGGASVDITGSASGAYQFTRQGELTAEVISLTSNRIGTLSRPNPGQLMFPRQTFPSAGQPGSAGNAVGVTAGTGNSFMVILNSFSYAHEYVSGGTVTISGTTYTISSASYSHATGVTTLSATGYTPNTGDSAVLSGLDFICPIQGAYIITGSVPIDASGNVVAADSSSLAGYRLNFFNTVNGGLRTPVSVGQQLDFRLRSQISCALHTMEFVGAGTNYDALPWNGGVPIPANQRVELNNGRVFGATINEKGDFEIGDGTFSIDGTTGEATINTSQFNISGLNFIGPFSRNGGFSTVGVQLKEISANTSLIASTGAADGNTAPTQSAVKAYVDSTTVQSVDLSAPTGFTSTGGPITGSGTLDLGYDTGYQGYLTAESTKLAGIEAGATADQTDAEIKVAYENNANTNAFTDAEQSKLSGIEANATQDQTAVEIKTAYESNGDTNAYTDAEQTKLAGIETNATQDQSATEIKTAYESNADTNAFTDTEKTKLAGIETGATEDQTDAEIKTAYENNSNTNAFTDAEQTKLGGIEAGAQVNVATNLSYTSGTRVVSSSTGADATLPLAVASGDAGLLTGADKTQLDNLSTDLAGKANLSGGKLALSEVPDLAITEFKGTVANQSAMLAITGQPGDWVVRSDDGKVYIITGSDPSQLSNWTALSYPASDVLSVNGLTGAVVLDADDISDASTTKKFTTAAEISKLAGIEAGATADQTDAEIKTAYENNSNTNAFTDAEQSKLSGIEAGATADQSASEIKTAYESNSDTNVFDDAAVSKLSGIEAGATADQTAAEIKTAYESNADTNEFSDAEQTKLAGIATGAQVNVATNLSYTASTRTVASSTGTDAVISEVVASGDSGLITGSDKSKLDGIESGATADQTAAQIKTAYLSNSDTNNFDDAAQTKLSGIAAGAEVNVNADWNSSSGDSQILNKPTVPTNNNQLTNGAGFITATLTEEQVEDFVGGMVTGNTETGIAVTYQDADGTLDFVVASQTDENFTTTLKNKLDGVASGAEVNVNADWDSSSGDSQILNKPTIPAAYTDSNVDTHLNTSTASSNEVLSWTGSDYDWVAQSGGGGTTDLSYTASTRVIASSTGTDATLPLMSTGDAGLVPASGGGTTNFLRADGTFAAPAGSGAVDSVNTQTGAVVLDADDISDTSTTNKYTNASDITKLAGIETGAEVNVDTNLSYTDATRVLTSSTGTNTTLPLMSPASAGLVPASGGGTANFLRADGTFAAQGSGSFGTAVYKGPSTSSSGDADGTAYSTVNVATAVGTPSGFFSNNGGQITISTPGTYLTSCTVVLTGSTSNYRWTGELEIQQFPTGGTLTALGSVRGGYIRVSSGSNDTYMTITRIITTTVANEILQFQLKRISTTSGDAEYVVNNSTIQIARIDGVPGVTGEDGPSNIPQNSQTSAYTLVASDDGKHVNTTTGGVTVPSGVFSAGDVVSIFNDSTSDQTIVQGASVTLRLAGFASTGNRTLAQYGLCTVLCVGSNEFVISGAGLS